MTEMVPYVPNARLNITINGQNGDHPDPMDFELTDEEIKRIATESLISGYVTGIDAIPDANLSDFVVDRFSATDELPPRLMIRPKTPFGAL